MCIRDRFTQKHKSLHKNLAADPVGLRPSASEGFLWRLLPVGRARARAATGYGDESLESESRDPCVEQWILNPPALRAGARRDLGVRAVRI